MVPWASNVPNCKVEPLLLMMTLEMNLINTLFEKGNYDFRLSLPYRIKEKSSKQII